MKHEAPFLLIPLAALLFCACAREAQRFADDKERTAYAWLESAQRDNGLLQGVEKLDVVSTYALSTAAMAYMLYDDYDRAERIFHFFEDRLVEEFAGPGLDRRGFIQMRHPNGAPIPDSFRWIGDNAWLLIALHHYRAGTGSDRYAELARAIAEYLADMQDVEGNELSDRNDGGIWYGYTADGSRRLHAKSSEGNLDAYVALAPYPDLQDTREGILRFLDTMYVPADRRLRVGSTAPETDSEMHAWAYCAFLDEARFPLAFIEQNFRLTVTCEATGKKITGFAFTPQDYALGRLEIAPTLETIAALYAAGKDRQADAYLAEIENNMIGSKLYPGTYGFTTIANKTRYPGDPTDVYNIAVHSTAWYLFVRNRFNPLQLN